MSQHFRLLTEQQVHSLLPMPDLISAMESALAKFSAREVLQPVRSVLTVGPTKAYFGLMPAYLPALLIAAAGWAHRWTNEDAFINFRIIDQRVRFDVSLDAADKNNVKLSSRLLTVAHQVHKGVN